MLELQPQSSSLTLAWRMFLPAQSSPCTCQRRETSSCSKLSSLPCGEAHALSPTAFPFLASKQAWSGWIHPTMCQYSCTGIQGHCWMPTTPPGSLPRQAQGASSRTCFAWLSTVRPKHPGAPVYRSSFATRGDISRTVNEIYLWTGEATIVSTELMCCVVSSYRNLLRFMMCWWCVNT